jgi:histidine triad (HIT) family protein
MHYDPSNVFGRILRGELPSHSVYEDAHTIAFMDAMPQATGHTLVLPKKASRNLFDADPATLAVLLPVVQRVARAALSAFAADGVSVMQFNEIAGGQSVFHLHFHVIPRFSGIPLAPHSGRMEDGAKLGEQARLLRAELAASALR